MPSALDSLHDVVKQHIDSGDVTGAIALVSHKGKIEFFEAQGRAEPDSEAPLRTDTVYWVASMTKPLTATSTMMLVEDGKVALDDQVSKHIPEFSKPGRVRTLKPDSPLIPPFPATTPPDPNAPKPTWDYAPAQRPITVRDLITMTSGLQTIGVPNDDIAPVTADDTLAVRVPRLADAALDFQPGSRWHYSNATGFDVLARIVEIASGKTYGEFLKGRIFGPLGMNDSGFGIRADLESRAAPLGRMAGTPMAAGKYQSGSAGLFMTASDYAKFAAMLLNNGEANGHRFLSAETVKQMSTNQTGEMFSGMTPGEYASRQSGEGKGVGYGLGFGIVTDAAKSNRRVPTGSFGWDGVGTRRFWVIPSLDAVIVMLTPSAGISDGMNATQRDIEGTAVEALKG